MTYTEWIAHTQKVIAQYNEGAIMDSEVFMSVLAAASEVDRKNLTEEVVKDREWFLNAELINPGVNKEN